MAWPSLKNSRSAVSRNLWYAMLGSSRLKSLTVVGMRGIVLSVPLSVLLIMFSYTQVTSIRFILALVFLLFLPGFDVLEVLYERTSFLTQLQRFVLSIALSIGIVIVDNYALTLLNIGINLTSLVAVLAGETVIVSLIPMILRQMKELGPKRVVS